MYYGTTGYANHEAELNPFFICDSLAKENPSTFTYLIKFSQDKIFFGHSPESLFSLKGNILKTEALAGNL